MTISVSEGGVFKEAKGIWTSKDGEWVVLKEPMPDFGLEVNFVGTPDNGYFEAIIYGENILDYTINLYAREYADLRATYLRVTTKDVPSTVEGPVTIIFSAGGVPASYRALVNPDGWVAAIYHVELVALDGTVTRSQDIPVQGEIQISNAQLESTAKAWDAEPNESRTVSSVWDNTAMRGVAPHASASWWWLMEVNRMAAVPVNYNFDTPLILAPGWGQPQGPYTHVRAQTEGGAANNLFRVETAPVAGSPFPAETLVRSIADNTLFPFVEEDWSPTPPMSVIAHEGSAGSYPSVPSMIMKESEGINAIAFYTTVGPYVPFDGTITLVDPSTITVTGPVGQDVALVYEFPVVRFDIATQEPVGDPYVRRSLAKTLDSAGNATFTPNDFPVMLEFGWTEFFAGTYRHTGATGSPSVVVNGACPALTYWEAHYYSVYASASWNIKYISSSVWSDSFTSSYSFYTYDGETTSDPYATVYMRRIHEPVLAEGWSRTEDDTMLLETLYPAFNIFKNAGDPVIGSAPPVETQVFSSSEIAGYVPGTMYPIRGLGYVDTVPYGFSGGNRGPNPGAGPWDNEVGNYSDYIYLYPVVHVEFLEPSPPSRLQSDVEQDQVDRPKGKRKPLKAKHK